MRTRSLLILGLLGAVLASVAAAQVPADSILLSPIVVTAARVPLPANAVASAVTVLDGEALRRAGVRTLADALRAVPSAAVAQAGAPGAVTSLFLRGGESDHVRVLVDGVPVNHPGGAVDLAALPLEHIERIEVVRGPASVLYGSDAVAGVVQVLTRRGGGAPRVGTEVAVGERGGAEVRGTAAGAWRHVSWSVGAGLQRTDGPYPLNSDWRSRLAAAQLAWTPDAGTEVRLAARLSDGRFHYPTDGAGAVVDSNQEQRGRLALVSLEAGRRLAARLTLRALVGLRASRDSTDDAPDGPGDTTGVYASWSAARVLRRSADVRADIGVGGSGVATLGAAVEHAHERSANGYRSAFGDGGGATDVGRVNRAAYAQAVLAPAGPVALQAGLRLDDNEAFGTFPTWRLGIAVRVAPRTRLRAAAGTAFKEPTFVENYAAGWAVGNPALRPERSRSLEAGVEQELAAGRAQLRLTAFAQRFRDLIQYTFLTAQAGDPNFYNVAAAESRGLEGEVQWMPSAAVRLRAQVTWLHTGAADSGFDGSVYAPGRRLLRRPTLSGSIGGDVQPRGRLAGGLRVLAVGSRDDLDFASWPGARVRLAPWGRLDVWARAALTRPRTAPGLELTLRVDDVTATAGGDVYGFRAHGRVTRVGIRFGAGP